MIKHKSFKHGWFYHYRVHEKKTEVLCSNGFSSLKDYLEKIFYECPDDYFDAGPRGSGLRISMPVKEIGIYGHEVSNLAELGLTNNHSKSAHSNVQMFMLERDDKTIAIEVPIWLTADEMKEYSHIFGCDEPLTGHIDAVRVEGDKIWVWDYKPNAHLEKHAVCQVYFYAIMLSKRTNIPLEKFMCGYFDDQIAYVFKPQEEMIKVLTC